VGGVGALSATRLEQPAGLARVEQLVQQPFFGAAGEETGAELAQHRVVEARVGQVEAKQVLPVNPGPDRLRGLPVR
jgi:hypothetical protein